MKTTLKQEKKSQTGCVGLNQGKPRGQIHRARVSIIDHSSLKTNHLSYAILLGIILLKLLLTYMSSLNLPSVTYGYLRLG